MSTATDDQEPRFKAGDRVEHSIFGKGTVKTLGSGITGDGTAVILFDDHGRKELELAFTAGKLKHIARRGEKP